MAGTAFAIDVRVGPADRHAPTPLRGSDRQAAVQEPEGVHALAHRPAVRPLAVDSGIVLKLALGRRVEFADPALRKLSAEVLRQAAAAHVRHCHFYPDATPYQVLGLAPDASERAIMEAFRLLMQLVHPDRQRVRGEWPEAFAAQANGAYAILRDADARAKFDREASERVARARSAQAAAVAAAAAVPPAPRWPASGHVMRRPPPPPLLPEWLTEGVGGFVRAHPAVVAFAALIGIAVLMIAAAAWKVARDRWRVRNGAGNASGGDADAQRRSQPRLRERRRRLLHRTNKLRRPGMRWRPTTARDVIPPDADPWQRRPRRECFRTQCARAGFAHATAGSRRDRRGAGARARPARSERRAGRDRGAASGFRGPGEAGRFRATGPGSEPRFGGAGAEHGRNRGAVRDLRRFVRSRPARCDRGVVRRRRTNRRASWSCRDPPRLRRSVPPFGLAPHAAYPRQLEAPRRSHACQGRGRHPHGLARRARNRRTARDGHRTRATRRACRHHRLSQRAGAP